MTSKVRISSGGAGQGVVWVLAEVPELVLPVRTPPRYGGDLVVTVEPATSAEGHKYLPAYSSIGEFEQSPHSGLIPLVVSGGELCSGWPEHELWLVLDPGLPQQRCIAGTQIRRAKSLTDDLTGRRSMTIQFS